MRSVKTRKTGNVKIIEQSLVAKSPRAKSEDGIVVTDDFVAVIDGSTSKTARRYSWFHTNGEQCMRLVAKQVRRMAKDTTAERFCREVTERVRKQYKRKELEHLAAHPEDRMAASCAVFSRVRREVWLIGDCQCLIGGQHLDNSKPQEKVIAERRAATAESLLAKGEATVESLSREDKARQAIIPDLVEAMKGQNIDYAVIDGFAIPRKKVIVVPLGFEPFTIVFATDGYPFLKETLAESEQSLALQLQGDPLCIRTFKATKGRMEGNNSFDDRAYIRFEI